MMLLAIDPATRCGFALAAPFGGGRPSIRCESWALGPGTNFERAQVLAQHLIALLKREQVIYAAVEIPMPSPPARIQRRPKGEFWSQPELVAAGNIKTQNLLWSLHGTIAGILAGFRIPCRPVGVKEWRAHTLGNGNIGGQDAKRRCKSLLEGMGVTVPNQDAAEAGGILIYLNGNYRRWQAEDQIGRAAA